MNPFRWEGGIWLPKTISCTFQLSKLRLFPIFSFTDDPYLPSLYKNSIKSTHSSLPLNPSTHSKSIRYSQHNGLMPQVHLMHLMHKPDNEYPPKPSHNFSRNLASLKMLKNNYHETLAEKGFRMNTRWLSYFRKRTGRQGWG